MVPVAQLVRAPGCGPGGREFNSLQAPHRSSSRDNVTKKKKIYPVVITVLLFIGIYFLGRLVPEKILREIINGAGLFGAIDEEFFIFRRSPVGGAVIG